MIRGPWISQKMTSRSGMSKQSDQASNANTTTPVHPRPWDQPLIVAYIELRLHHTTPHTTPHTHPHIFKMSSELASYAHGCAFFSATGVIFLVSSTTEEAEWDPLLASTNFSQRICELSQRLEWRLCKACILEHCASQLRSLSAVMMLCDWSWMVGMTVSLGPVCGDDFGSFCPQRLTLLLWNPFLIALFFYHIIRS
jgi:hypothetical protein